MSLKASITHKYNTVHNVNLFKLQTLPSEHVDLNGVLKAHFVILGMETVLETVFMTQ